jgi:predicted ribosomally synthesized peptide with nif11-like leader
MNLEVIHFLKQVGNNQELLARLGNCPTPADIVRFAREAGYEITEDEYQKTAEVIKSILKVMDKEDQGELSDANLDTVVGGTGPNIIPLLNDLNLGAVKKLLGL